MRRGSLFIDYTENTFAVATNKAQYAEPKIPELEPRTQSERAVENMNERVGKGSLLLEEKNGERDDYEQDESKETTEDLESAISTAKLFNDVESVERLEKLKSEIEAQQKSRTMGEEGESIVESLQDAPPVEPKPIVDLVEELEGVDNPEDEKVLIENVKLNIASSFQKEIENVGKASLVKDPIEMHEYSKLVNASYQFFEHRDFGKISEYMNSKENAYIPNFNRWQVNETYSSSDNLVFVRYGRNLNNPLIVIACRGTAQTGDWAANAAMVGGGTEQVGRFKDLESTYHQLQSVFPTGRIQVTGHSQGGGLSYALAQKYNLKGYHFDPAIFPTFRNAVQETSRSWTSSSLISLVHSDRRSRKESQIIYRNALDPVSMMTSVMENKENVKVRTVGVNASSNILSPHSLQNYYLNGYDGDVSAGVPVMRGGNVRSILEPVMTRAASTTAVRKTGNVGGGIAVGLTVNDTYHAVKRIEEDTNLTRSEKRTKQMIETGTSVTNLTVSAGVAASVETAAATLLTGMGATGAIAVGAPLLMGAAAAVAASYAIRWIGGKLSNHATDLAPLLNPDLKEIEAEKTIKKRKRDSR